MSTEAAPEHTEVARAATVPGVTGQPPTRGELLWYQFARSLVTSLCRLPWRITVVGRENLPQTSPYILAPVHRSYVDTLMAGYVTSRRLRFMGKEEWFERPWVARLSTSLGAFPVKRGMPDRAALQTCERVLAGGEPLVLFPEGARQSGPVVGELYGGPAFVSLRANVPIVPLGIGGSERALPKGARWVRSTRIGLVIGKPIWPPPSPRAPSPQAPSPQAPSPHGSRAPRRAVGELTGQLHSELQAVFDQARALAGA